MIESRIISDFIESCIDEEFHQKKQEKIAINQDIFPKPFI